MLLNKCIMVSLLLSITLFNWHFYYSDHLHIQVAKFLLKFKNIEFYNEIKNKILNGIVDHF